MSNSSIHAFVSVGAAQYDASDVGAASMRPELRRVGTAEAHTQLPVLSSHCPGWVCYAEKSQPQAIPYVSTVKSAQQILGSVTKAILSQDSAYSGVTAPGCKNGVYFVSVQPCFDKKLEASRLVSVAHMTLGELEKCAKCCYFAHDPCRTSTIRRRTAQRWTWFSPPRSCGGCWSR